MTETQRVAIVTGAAGGIGTAMVRGLLAAGIRVAGVNHAVSRWRGSRRTRVSKTRRPTSSPSKRI